jgi:hypothetical protein
MLYKLKEDMIYIIFDTRKLRGICSKIKINIHICVIFNTDCTSKHYKLNKLIINIFIFILITNYFLFIVYYSLYFTIFQFL